MKKVLVGQFGEKVLRGANGKFVSKQKAKVMDYDDKVVLIGDTQDEKRFAEEFGKEYTIRDLTDEDTKLESKKLTDIR
jgi:hypothetical protein